VKEARKFWIMAALFGIIAALVAYKFIEEVRAKYEPDDLRTVVKAVTDIPRDSVIAPEQVVVEKVPAKFSHPKAARSKSEVVGKLATGNIAAGQEILADKVLTDQAKARRLAYSIREGMRAITIPVDVIKGVAGFVKPGDRVDIIATVDAPVNGTIFFLQNIEVLAVDQRTSDMQTTPEGTTAPGPAAMPASTLTLLVTPEQAQGLSLVAEKCSIRLVLRSPADDKPVVLPPYQMSSVARVSGKQQ